MTIFIAQFLNFHKVVDNNRLSSPYNVSILQRSLFLFHYIVFDWFYCVFTPNYAPLSLPIIKGLFATPFPFWGMMLISESLLILQCATLHLITKTDQFIGHSLFLFFFNFQTIVDKSNGTPLWFHFLTPYPPVQCCK